MLVPTLASKTYLPIRKAVKRQKLESIFVFFCFQHECPKPTLPRTLNIEKNLEWPRSIFVKTKNNRKKNEKKERKKVKKKKRKEKNEKKEEKIEKKKKEKKKKKRKEKRKEKIWLVNGYYETTQSKTAACLVVNKS